MSTDSEHTGTCPDTHPAQARRRSTALQVPQPVQLELEVELEVSLMVQVLLVNHAVGEKPVLNCFALRGLGRAFKLTSHSS